MKLVIWPVLAFATSWQVLARIKRRQYKRNPLRFPRAVW